RADSGGFRIHEMDHLVYNNYVDGAEGSAIRVGDGDPYDDPDFSHAQVKRGKIFHNIFFNCGAIDLGDAHPLDPVNLVIANNISLNTSFSGGAAKPGWIYSSNLICHRI